MTQQTRKLVNVRLYPDLWKEAKLAAVRREINLQDWLTEAIAEKLKREN